MLTNGFFLQNDILGSAMNAAVVRNDIINNNIANVDTPNFKRSSVKFESILNDLLKDYKKTGRINLSNASPIIQKEYTNFSYRIDGNNVDIESEMVDLYKNSVRYDVLTSSIINNYKRINAVLSTR